jgi:hypothetical protein
MRKRTESDVGADPGRRRFENAASFPVSPPDQREICIDDRQGQGTRSGRVPSVLRTQGTRL